jgi:hypothetical protein
LANMQNLNSEELFNNIKDKENISYVSTSINL